jgi:transglutaminase-like putative cysteine protease
MQYDIRLRLDYDYGMPVSGGRHLLRVVPASLGTHQQCLSVSIDTDPAPSERVTATDFFGNNTLTLAFRTPHRCLDITMKARVAVAAPVIDEAASGLMDERIRLLAAVPGLEPASPHHYRGPTDLAEPDPAIAAFARKTLAGCRSMLEAGDRLCRRIYEDFTYEPDVTDVRTTAAEAFHHHHGVCQDFAHVMIAALRSEGFAAGYVSGFLRTFPPPGMPRLEGADAMHAWVRLWCGPRCGWVDFDPTNGIRAGDGHITVAIGRDYHDVPPILGILRTSGRHSAGQAVDVIPLDDGAG